VTRPRRPKSRMNDNPPTKGGETKGRSHQLKTCRKGTSGREWRRRKGTRGPRRGRGEVRDQEGVTPIRSQRGSVSRPTIPSGRLGQERASREDDKDREAGDHEDDRRESHGSRVSLPLAHHLHACTSVAMAILCPAPSS